MKLRSALQTPEKSGLPSAKWGAGPLGGALTGPPSCPAAGGGTRESTISSVAPVRNERTKFFLTRVPPTSWNVVIDIKLFQGCQGHAPGIRLTAWGWYTITIIRRFPKEGRDGNHQVCPERKNPNGRRFPANAAALGA